MMIITSITINEKENHEEVSAEEVKKIFDELSKIY